MTFRFSRNINRLTVYILLNQFQNFLWQNVLCPNIAHSCPPNIYFFRIRNGYNNQFLFLCNSHYHAIPIYRFICIPSVLLYKLYCIKWIVLKQVHISLELFMFHLTGKHIRYMKVGQLAVIIPVLPDPPIFVFHSIAGYVMKYKISGFYYGISLINFNFHMCITGTSFHIPSYNITILYFKRFFI